MERIMTLGDVGASTTCGTRTHAMTPRPKQASELRVLYIHTRAGAASHTGTLTPMLHLTTSQAASRKSDCFLRPQPERVPAESVPGLNGGTRVLRAWLPRSARGPIRFFWRPGGIITAPAAPHSGTTFALETSSLQTRDCCVSRPLARTVHRSLKRPSTAPDSSGGRRAYPTATSSEHGQLVYFATDRVRRLPHD